MPKKNAKKNARPFTWKIHSSEKGELKLDVHQEKKSKKYNGEKLNIHYREMLDNFQLKAVAFYYPGVNKYYLLERSKDIDSDSEEKLEYISITMAGYVDRKRDDIKTQLSKIFRKYREACRADKRQSIGQQVHKKPVINAEQYHKNFKPEQLTKRMQAILDKMHTESQLADNSDGVEEVGNKPLPVVPSPPRDEPLLIPADLAGEGKGDEKPAAVSKRLPDNRASFFQNKPRSVVRKYKFHVVKGYYCNHPDPQRRSNFLHVVIIPQFNKADITFKDLCADQSKRFSVEEGLYQVYKVVYFMEGMRAPKDKLYKRNPTIREIDSENPLHQVVYKDYIQMGAIAFYRVHRSAYEKLCKIQSKTIPFGSVNGRSLQSLLNKSEIRICQMFDRLEMPYDIEREMTAAIKRAGNVLTADEFNMFIVKFASRRGHVLEGVANESKAKEGVPAHNMSMRN